MRTHLILRGRGLLFIPRNQQSRHQIRGLARIEARSSSSSTGPNTAEQRRSHQLDEDTATRDLLSDDISLPSPSEEERRSLESLNQRLNFLVSKGGSVKPVRAFLAELVYKHRSQPTSEHYEALLLGHADSMSGSAAGAKAILDEMNRENVSLVSSQGFRQYSSLVTLSVHPDYITRSELLDQARREWTTPPPHAQSLVVAGLIRDGQLELAYLEVRQMLRNRISVDTWLCSLLTCSLVETGDFNAVLRFLYTLEDERFQIPTSTWHYILDEASQKLELDLVRYVWQLQVEPNYIIPSIGLCYNVLMATARSGDTQLAESVRKILAEKRDRPSETEIELLLETYTTAGDREGAARVRSVKQQDADQNSRPLVHVAV